MKRHFLTGLKALAVSALAFAAVSCYDDSKLWTELEGLEQRVAALEEKLNSEVATLNSKLGAVEAAYKKADDAFNIADENVAAALKALTAELDALDGTVDGYVTSNDAALKKAIEDLMKADKENADAYKALADMDADLLAALSKLGVVSVEKKEDGSVVLTFADKSTVTVGAPVENADNTGLVTIVDGEWAVIDEDGAVKKLGVAVDPETELFFRVKDNVLEISYDGKKTWVSTEVEVNDETSLNVVTDVQYTEGDAYVTVVVGEAEYVLPFYQADNSELTLGRTDAFFMYGATKNIELKAEGVKEYYVMSKPDGWKASLENNVLTVTAPAKELVELGAGELKGEVLVHATADNGTCKVASFKVSTGEALSLTYDNGNVTVFNALTSEMDDENGDKMKEFYYVHLGIADEDYYRTFETSKEFYENAFMDFETTNPFRLPAAGDSYYVEGVREEQSVTLTLDQVADALGLTLSEEKNYVLFAIPAVQKPMYDEGKMAFTATFIDVNFSNIVYNDIDISISTVGAESYIVGAANKTAIDEMAAQYPGYDFNTYLEMGNGMNGPWAYFQYGMTNAMGIVLNGDKNQVKLSDVVVSEDGFTFGVEGETEYYVWILPYTEERAPSEYSISELYVTTCKTADLTYNSALAANVTIVPEYYKVNFTVESPEGAKTFYYLYEKAYYDNLASDYNFVSDLKMKCQQPSVGTETLSETYGINPGKEYVLVTYTVSGPEYGDVKKYPVSTPAIPYDESISVAFKSISIVNNKYVVAFDVTGAASAMGLNVSNYKESFNATYLKNILNKPGAYPSYLWSNVKDNVVEFTFDYSSNKTHFVVWAYNADASGVTSLQPKPFVVKLADVIPTLDKKQWVFESAVLDNMAYDGEEVTAPLDHVLDLGVAYTPENYEYFEEATWVLATNWKEIFEEEDYWMADFNGETPYAITPTNLSSGTITLPISDMEINIPYSEFTGTTCKFDFAELFTALELEGESVVTAQASTENIVIPFL